MHPDYEGTSDWTATAGFGSVADGLTRPTAEATARAFFDTFRSVGFDNRTTTLTEVTTDQADLGGHQVALISGNVGYTVPGVPSTYDRVLVIVLPRGGRGATPSTSPAVPTTPPRRRSTC